MELRENNAYLSKVITKLLGEFGSAYSTIQSNNEEMNWDGPELQSQKKNYYREQEQIMNERMEKLGPRIFRMTAAYIEANALPEYLRLFLKEVEPIVSDTKKLKEGEYYIEIGEDFSRFVSVMWSFLNVFEEFGRDYYRTGHKPKDAKYLEHILESTGLILKESKVIPTNESEVYKAVSLVCRATFARATYPTESFQKLSKCYKPDILIPELKAAIEYKIALSEIDLTTTMDQILADVKGYKGNSSYQYFYAVFYFQSGICTKTRFKELWTEREFPSNWMAFMVEGDLDKTTTARRKAM